MEKQEILFKTWNNFFKFKDEKFYSHGVSNISTYSVGSWFNCKKEEVDRLRIAILSGNFKLYSKLPRGGKIYNKGLENLNEKT